MNGIAPETLSRFVQLAGERLSGAWVILGGSVIPLLGGRVRPTLDIDLAGPDDAGAEATSELMRIALDLGLPVEAINQSAAFFLRAIPGWRTELQVLHAGPAATVHVPTPTLYVLLKLERLTPADLDDCEAMLRLARAGGRSVDAERLRAAIDARLASGPSAPRRKRLVALRAAIDVDRRD